MSDEQTLETESQPKTGVEEQEQQPQADVEWAQEQELEQAAEGETTEQEVSATSNADETGADDQSVPYSRFAEIYRKQKEMERENQRLQDQLKSKPAAPAVDTGKPQQGDFDSYDEYVEALTDWKWEQNNQKQQREQQENQRRERYAQFDDKISRASIDDPNFGSKAYIPNALLEHFMDVAHPIKLAYYFGENPQEAQRIVGLPPIPAAIEIGRIEGKLKSKSTLPPRSKTKAPAPTSPVGNRATPTKDPANMTTAEYIAWRNQQEYGGGAK